LPEVLCPVHEGHYKAFPMNPAGKPTRVTKLDLKMALVDRGIDGKMASGVYCA